MLQRYLIGSILLVGLFCSVLIAQDKHDEVIRIDTSLVNIPVIVSDRDNRYIPGLAARNFRVFEDGTEQKVEVFSSDQAPMNIVLALDTSRSTEAVLGKIKKAAKEFIKDLDADDRCLVMSFDDDLEFLSELTSDKKVLEKAINHAKIGDAFGTLLQDAVFAAVNNKFHDVKGRKAIILLTDGKDFGSLITKAELYNELNESDNVIYPVFYETGGMMRQPRIRAPRIPNGGMGRRGGIGRFPGQRIPRDPFPDVRFPRPRQNSPAVNARIEANDRAAIAFLDRLADITGGRSFIEKKADLRDAFRQIADEMKRQYLIGFYPSSDSPRGTVHRVKVEVDRPGAVVRSKSAYRTRSK